MELLRTLSTDERKRILLILDENNVWDLYSMFVPPWYIAKTIEIVKNWLSGDDLVPFDEVKERIYDFDKTDQAPQIKYFRKRFLRLGEILLTEAKIIRYGFNLLLKNELKTYIKVHNPILFKTITEKTNKQELLLMIK